MRLSIFLMCVQIGYCLAGDTYAQSLKFTLRLEDRSVAEVLHEIERKSEYIFFYADGALDMARKVDIDVTDTDIEHVLRVLFLPTNNQWTINDRQIVITRGPELQQISLVRVAGRVTSASGGPVAGANVIVKGTNIGTATDASGRYSLPVPVDRTHLVFSFLGMKTVEESIAGRTTVNVTLHEAAEKISEVVVTGYQSISRERSAGSFSSIGGDNMAEKVSLNGTILESLEGLATGLTVNFGDGEEKMTLRGITSINATTTPLYVVDNIPMSSENVELMVNENDIESITVLKDATAASIWGAQAANGVIVIMTRKGGDTAKRMKIGYDGSFTYSGYPDYGYMDYMSSEMFIKNALEIFDPSYYSWDGVTSQIDGIDGQLALVFPHEIPMYEAHRGLISTAERDSRLAQLAAQNNRGQIEDYLMSPKFFTKHSLSFMGGSDRYTFYGSLAYEFNQDNYRNDFDKYAVNLRQDFKLTDWLSVDLTTTIAIVDNKNALQLDRLNGDNVSGNSTQADRFLPYMMLRDGQGNNLSWGELINYGPVREEMERKSLLGLDYVPLDEIHKGFNKRNSFNARLNAGVTIRLMEGLHYEGRFSYQRNNHKSQVFNDQTSYVVREELAMFTVPSSAGGTPTYYLPTSGGKYEEQNGYQNNWTVRNQLSFDRTFGESEVTVLAGMETQANRTTTTTNNVRGYDPQTMTMMQYDELALSNGIRGAVMRRDPYSSANRYWDRAFRSNETEYRFVSLYANAAYTFGSRYSVNGSIRVDQSNLFGSDPSVQWKPVWSAGFNWNIANEKFMQDVHWVNRLNLRLSYGLGGNSPSPGQGGSYDILSPNTNSIYSGLGIGYYLDTPANKKLRWERTRTLNAGVDFGLLGSVLWGSIDVYNKSTTDLLSSAPLNPVSGWTSATANIAEMSNRGFEVSLNSRNIRTRDFMWTTSLAISHNRNMVKKFYMDYAPTPTSIVYFSYREGYAANSIFAYRWAGLDDQGNPQAYDTDGKTKVTQGYELTDTDAAKYQGTSQPPWFGSLTNTFSYKGLELSFMFVYNFGHKMRDDVNMQYNGRMQYNMHKDFDKRWRKAGDEAFTNVPSYTPSYSYDRDINLYYFSDLNVLDASYIKLRNLTLSYSLPRTLCDKLSAESVKVRVQASNLFYWAANGEGIDPESQNYAGRGLVNHFGAGLRNPRFGPTYSVGLSVNFK